MADGYRLINSSNIRNILFRNVNIKLSVLFGILFFSVLLLVLTAVVFYHIGYAKSSRQNLSNDLSETAVFELRLKNGKRGIRCEESNEKSYDYDTCVYEAIGNLRSDTEWKFETVTRASHFEYVSQNKFEAKAGGKYKIYLEVPLYRLEVADVPFGYLIKISNKTYANCMTDNDICLFDCNKMTISTRYCINNCTIYSKNPYVETTVFTELTVSIERGGILEVEFGRGAWISEKMKPKLTFQKL